MLGRKREDWMGQVQTPVVGTRRKGRDGKERKRKDFFGPALSRLRSWASPSVVRGFAKRN